MAWNNFDAEDHFHPLHQWVPWGDSNLAGRTLGRMTSTLTPDSHAFIFANTQSGIVSRWETSPGSWSAWAQWFPGASMNSNVVDVEAVSANPVALQVYTVHTDGRLRTRRKVGAFDAAWDNEVDLGVVPGARAIAAGVVGGYQSLFAITNNAVSTRWETSPGSNQWEPWIDFTAGLPAGLELLDVTADFDRHGYIDLYVLGKQTDGVVKVFRRTKLGFVGAGWSNWSPFLTVPARTTQIEAGQGSIEEDPRLLLLNDGEILIRRSNAFNIDGTSPDFVIPAYSPERTTSCPAAPPPLPC